MSAASNGGKRLRHEGGKVLIGLAVLAAVLLPMLLGGWLGYRIAGDVGFFLGGMMWPGIWFIGFMAWVMGDSFQR